MHAFTDGRDTLPHAGAAFLARARSHAGRARGLGRRALLGDGPRPALGAHAARVRHARPRSRAIPRRQRRAGGQGRLRRGETDEFIEPTLVGAEAAIRPGDSVIAFNFRPDRMREITRALAEAGFGPHPADDPGSSEELPGWTGRGGVPAIARYTTLTRYEEGWPYPVVFSRGAPREHASGGARARGRVAAARGGDGEVPARDVLLQRRRGDADARRAARAGALAAGRADVRPQAADERARGGGGVRWRVAGGRAALRDHQLRQRGHGRSHGRDRGGGEGDRDGGRVPGRGGRARSTSAAACAW